MSNRIPQWTLAMLLLVAACVIAGGVALSRRSETVRHTRDRGPLRDFAGMMDHEMGRLERLYESHLSGIARELDPKNPVRTRTEGERIVGIQQVSVVYGAGNSADQHIPTVPLRLGANLPEPTLRTERADGLREKIALPQRDLLQHVGERSGWIDRPGERLLFWCRQEGVNAAVVFLMDREELMSTVDAWFRAWLASGADRTLDGLLAAGGPDQILGAAGTVLMQVGEEHLDGAEPSYLLPLRGRFGTWHLASWDRQETLVRYHLPTLIGAAALGIFTAGLGLIVFIQQTRAAALARQRVSFVNRVSHELRTPLTNILLNIELAQEQCTEAAGGGTRRLALVQEETRRLGRLIDNVLTFSRREQGKLKPEPRMCVPLSAIAAVVEQFSGTFQRRGLDITTAGDCSAPCMVDADALVQILGNLLSNVEKYVPAGGVEIHGQQTGNALVIRVADSGPGIPLKEAARIFRPFERLENRVNEGATGTGLGLAIARDLAENLGGTLHLVPSVRGACFELRIPAPIAEVAEYKVV